ncbi:cupin domain-containing protein [Melioribacter sp. OK-6-Me]|uniref:cupin domain-containing protein n=1 Tax=unclassified Melioribacter TaxID=2627329 RepID=UPI003EDAAE08
MKIINIKEMEDRLIEMAGAYKVHKQIPISSADGTPAYSMRVFTLEPSGYTPYHSHDYEQLNYVIEGYGVLVDKEGHEHTLKEGDFALVLPNEYHQYKNISENTNFVFICVVPKQYE